MRPAPAEVRFEMAQSTSKSPQAPSPRPPARWFVLLTAVMIVVAGALALFVAPRAQEQAGGDAQRIFYFHVSSAWLGFGAMAASAYFGWRYLRSRQMRWDWLALANAEISVVFLGMVLLSGMAWGRPTWNVWWTWQEPKLVVSALQFLLYVALLVLRSAIDEPERRARLSAVFGLLTIILVPFNLLISRVIADGVHPVVFGPSVSAEAQGKVGVATTMVPILLFALVAFSLLWVVFVQARVALQARMDALAARRAALLDLPEGGR
ncbi:MAG: cytochrome c biogenesis protein CcsA [Thermoflexales bacterium]|nr:cytochrome c biogenesis protein CcsA [Thermoflexales bacterium]